jgi:hypothetical protein
MGKENTHINNPFTRLANRELPDVDSMEWLAMQKKLRRQNFMQFGIRHFNIFYVAGFVLMVLAAFLLMLGTEEDKERQGVEIQKNAGAALVEKACNVDSAHDPVEIKMNTARDSRQRHLTETDRVEATRDDVHQANMTEDSITKPSKEQTSVVIPEIVTAGDTTTKENHVTTPARAPVKVKRVVYKTSADTVVEHDTTRVERKKRKGLFSK